MYAQLAAALVEAENRGLDPNIVKPGWTALGIVALLGVATFFLSRSFLKHAKRAQQPWEGEPVRRDDEEASAPSAPERG